MEDKHVSPADFVDLIENEEVKEAAKVILPSLPDDNLKAIARDVCSGVKFFATDPEVVELSFGMLLMFMEELPENVCSMYADMKDAAPRGINGYPMFFSAGMLNMEDTRKVIEYIKKIEEAVNAI